MADLVERLRKLSDDCMEDGYEDQGIGLHDAADELDRLRADVASLKEDNEQAYISLAIEGVRPSSLRDGIADLTQQLAAANGRVERCADALRWIAAQPASGAIQSRAVAALSDLPEADKEKS